VVAAVVGYAFSQRAVFLLVPVFATLASIAVLSIPGEAIDLDRARDLDRAPGAATGPAGYGILLKSRPLVIFGLCVMLFHLANAALLPLVGQKLAAAYPKEVTAMMSACIVAAQAVMLPIALLVGHTADSWGRKPLFLAGFAILPIRAVLYTLSDNSFWLIGVQLLDGVGAGIFGAWGGTRPSIMRAMSPSPSGQLFSRIKAQGQGRDRRTEDVSDNCHQAVGDRDRPEGRPREDDGSSDA
jgi:hypothetical protein